MPAPHQAKTVSLVLGSGGARGLAHVGVIRYLVENGYEIRSIAGSSIGALIGGIYAAGKLEQFADWIVALERMHIIRLLDPALSRSGLIKGERIIGLLRKLVGDINIEDLPMAFVAVAMEFHTGSEVWLRQGDLFDAIRASIAIPMIFTPFQRDGHYMVDGGTVNPVPVAPTLSDRTDLTVVVSLSGRAETRMAVPPEMPAAVAGPYRQRMRAFIDSLTTSAGNAVPSIGMMDVALKSMDVMQSTITRFKLAAYTPEVTIEIPHNACQFHEFWRAEEMIALGKARAARAFSRQQTEHGALKQNID